MPVGLGLVEDEVMQAGDSEAGDDEDYEVESIACPLIDSGSLRKLRQWMQEDTSPSQSVRYTRVPYHRIVVEIPLAMVNLGYLG
jgi:hypothetical protein